MIDSYFKRYSHSTDNPIYFVDERRRIMNDFAMEKCFEKVSEVIKSKAHEKYCNNNFIRTSRLKIAKIKIKLRTTRA